MRLTLTTDDGTLLDMVTVTRAEWDRAASSMGAAAGLLDRLSPGDAETAPRCACMTEDLHDGMGERVVEHSLRCDLHPEYDPPEGE